MIAYAVSTVPSRADLYRELASQLSRPPRVYIDDKYTGGSWYNYRRALLDAGQEGEDWLVCLDDDALLCPGFETQIEKALSVCPGDFASFFFTYQSLTEAARSRDACWISTCRIVHGICFAIRAELAAEVVAVAEQIVRPEHYSGDQRLLTWLAWTGRRNYVSMPSLVDHRSDVSSCIGNGQRNSLRTARWFGVRDQWTDKTLFDSGHTAHEALQLLGARGALSVVVPGAEELRARMRGDRMARLHALARDLSL